MYNLVFQNIDILSVGFALATIFILGFTVYFNDRHNKVNQTFLVLCLAGGLWSIFNFLSYSFRSEYLVLTLLRLAIFFAAWFSYYIFEMFYLFPYESKELAGWRKYFFSPLIVLVSIINLTPFVFVDVAQFSEQGIVSRVTNGPGIAIFGLAVFSCVFTGIYLLFKKLLKSSGSIRRQMVSMTVGISITSALLIVFNFILPAFFDNPDYITWGAVFLFPFLTLTSYALIKHHLFDVRVIATEVLTFVLAVVTLVEVILSDSTSLFVLRSFVFILTLGFGIILIKSVRIEFKQREELQILSSKLGIANEQLTALDKARAEFISIASHQLRTPPATIKWYLAAVRAGDFGKVNPKVLDAIQKAETTNNTQISLIDDLLNVSRIERGKMEFIFEETDFEVLVQQTVDQMYPQAKTKKINLVYTKPKNKLPKLMADKEKLQQVVNNLIDNAIKYTKTGNVNIQLDKKDQDIVLKVIDTGKGMAKDEMLGIFQKFGRGRDSFRHTAGLGLGLYVAKVILEHHHGKIWAVSKGVGSGSTFVVQLPLVTDLSNESEFDFVKEGKKNARNRNQGFRG